MSAGDWLDLSLPQHDGTECLTVFRDPSTGLVNLAKLGPAGASGHAIPPTSAIDLALGLVAAAEKARSETGFTEGETDALTSLLGAVDRAIAATEARLEADEK